MRVPGDAARMPSAARTPPPPGIFTSRMATSGRWVPASSMALCGVGRQAHDLVAGLAAQQVAEGAAHGGVVVGDEHPDGHHATEPAVAAPQPSPAPGGGVVPPLSTRLPTQ